MKVLLDTGTLAELRKPRPDAAVVATVSAIPDEKLFLSVVSVGEIVQGIGLLAAGKKRNELSAWIAALEGQFSERILPVDVATAKLWGELTARARKKGLMVHAADGLIAATALRHGLHVMTRNEADFQATGARIINPWRGECLERRTIGSRTKACANILLPQGEKVVRATPRRQPDRSPLIRMVAIFSSGIRRCNPSTYGSGSPVGPAPPKTFESSGPPCVLGTGKYPHDSKGP